MSEEATQPTPPTPVTEVEASEQFSLNVAASAEELGGVEALQAAREAGKVNDDGTLKAADDATPPTEEVTEPKADEEEVKVDDLKLTKDEEEPSEANEGEVEQLDMTEFYAEYAANGSLSEKSQSTIVDRLTGAGFADAEAILNQYIAGADTQVAQVRAAVFDITGGEAGYAAMGEWARGNLSAADLAAYDAMAEDPATAQLAVRGLHAQYQAATGTTAPPQAPAPVDAGPNVQAGHQGGLITSPDELATVVSDPRMGTDPAYTASTEARIRASMQAGHLK